MTWNKKAGKKIGKQQAQSMIDKYQKAHKASVRSVYFDNDMIQSLINVKGSVGISIFFAMNDENQNTVVLLPVDETGKIIHETTSSSDSATLSSSSTITTDTAVEVGNPCPPYCPK